MARGRQKTKGPDKATHVPAAGAAPALDGQGQVPLAPGLYLLPSPLGNLGDLSQRFIDVLSGVQAVAAEDTRRTLKLLSHLGLRKRLYGYREENHASAFPLLKRHLENGDAVALVTDAGAPGICDPGAFLVSQARKAGLAVFPVPGPSAVITALMASGFEASSFSFLGFLPPRPERRRALLESVRDRREALVVFIPPHKLPDTLADLVSVLGPRPAFMAREMTKLHEEYLALPLPDLLDEVARNPRRGEITLVIGPGEAGGREPLDDEALGLIASDPRPTREVAAHFAGAFGWTRKSMYDLILRLRASGQGDGPDGKET
ncbi:MAG: 16S rRNA (cytidine(1402)-2'-O)-methyltransferase [Deltaproteobacteria bacterium]|nr:16S rRNA (cytidine(1402)-2'-O)-methyltransferase [Deltaproteobacteria bacterium]